MLIDDRYLDPIPSQKECALRLYQLVKAEPIISPHGHVDPAIFSQADYRYANPVTALFQTDHYTLRMLYSQGIPYEAIIYDENPRSAWQIFADNYYLFHGTPSGLWITHLLEIVFGVTEKLQKKTAQTIYDQVQSHLLSDDFTPRKLYDRFNIEVLATTDEASAPLTHHQALRKSGWHGRIIPTFRPDSLFQLQKDGWKEKIDQLGQLTDLSITGYSSFLEAIEKRREDFKALGTTAIDISAETPKTTRLDLSELERIFESALKGEVLSHDADLFTAHMLYEMARMSCEDGLIMQLHPGIFRNHNPQVYNQFGKDMGFDIPVPTEFTNNLHILLNDFGNNQNFSLILFTLDESTYSRELAPLAGAYPCIKIGPPWWFMDSWYGMKRYFEAVMETAGIYNTVGFNDDSRSLLSIPVRHDVWRRASANWLANLLVRGIIDEEDAEKMIYQLSGRLAKSAYRL